MSLHQIFDYVWNFPIPWLWIFIVLGSLVAVFVGIAATIAQQIRKEERNDKKP